MLTLVAALAVTTVASARLWTDSTGSMQKEAEFVRLMGEVVYLRTPDGKLAQVPLATLSATDQEFIASGAAATANQPQVPAQPAPVVEQPEGPMTPERFTQAIQNNPNDPSAYYQRAMALTKRGEHQAAMEDYNKALQLNPQMAEAYDGRGEVYAKMNDATRAHQDFSKAIEINPELASAYKHRADNLTAYAKTPAGKIEVDAKLEQFRKTYNAVAQKNRRAHAWQPLNNTTGNVSRYQGIKQLAALDLEKYYEYQRDGGCPCGDGYGVNYGGGGVAIGGPGYVVPGPAVIGPGLGLKPIVTDPPLLVYPLQVKQGETITLVANPAALAKGLIHKVAPGQGFDPNASGVYDPNAKIPRRVQNQIAAKDVEAVDFYRDVDKDNLLDPTADEYLGTDMNGIDGFTKEVPTSAIPPGNQSFFAVPRGGEMPENMRGQDAQPKPGQEYLTLAEMLDRAAEEERAVAEAAKTAASAGGLSLEEAQSLSAENENVCDICQDAVDALSDKLPLVSQVLEDASKPLSNVGENLGAAQQQPGEASKSVAGEAAPKAEAAAEQLAEAADMLREEAKKAAEKYAEQMAEAAKDDPQLALANVPQGAPAPAQAQIMPGDGAPAPGPGKDGDGGGDGDDCDGDDDDDVNIHNDYGDDYRYANDDDEDYHEDLDEVDEYVEVEDYDRAVVEYDRLVEDYPDDYVVLRRRADVQLARGGYEYAVRDYDRVIEQRPSADLYYNRGCAFLASGELEKALADFNRSIELNETWNLAYNNRGTTYARMGDFERAIADFEKALELNASDVVALRNRARAYQKLGQEDKARADLARIEQIGLE